MRIPLDREQKIKVVIHAVQAAVIFIAGCLTLAVMTKPGPATGGPTTFYFVLCLLSIPALIYQVMVPMWTRAWRFVNVYAYACVDIVWAILWFAAGAAVAAWNAQGVCANAPAQTATTTSKPAALMSRDGTSGSSTATPVDSSAKCSTSKATVAFALLLTVLFSLSAAISVRAVMTYRRTGTMPNTQPASATVHKRPLRYEEDPSKDPWSTETDEVDRESSDELRFGQDDVEGQQQLFQEGGHGQPGLHHDMDTAYHPVNAMPSGGYEGAAPYDPTGPGYVPFPSANYGGGRY